jgi:hypothetical protein
LREAPQSLGIFKNAQDLINAYDKFINAAAAPSKNTVIWYR